MARNKRFLEGWDTVSVLGVGGFGKVYEIRKSDAPDKFKSALKVISIPKDANEIKDYEDDGYDEKSIFRILEAKKQKVISEFDLMANFKGTSNIVSYEDHYVKPHANGIGWDILIRMELLKTLPDYLGEKGFVSEKDVIDVARDMCKALILCSEKNIIHRDIKPQNIFRNDFGDYKLGDFGIAKESDHTTKATKTGTYSYMAPEVYRGDQYGKNVDIYSLGMVLYWLLNEKRGPFLPLPPIVASSDDVERATIKRFSGERIPSPKHGSPRLVSIVLKAIEFDPETRYYSAQEMLDDLQRISGSDDPMYRVAKPKKKMIPVEQEDTEDEETVTLVQGATDVTDSDSIIFEITFDPDNGQPIRRIRVKPFEVLVAPANPEREGYKFIGWYDYGTKFNFNKPIDHNVYLKAIYKRKSALLKVLIAIAVIVALFAFISAEGENISFLRKYFVNDSYIVYFDGNGGKSQLESIRIEANHPIENMPEATIGGQYFDGWYDNPVTGNYYDNTTPITENIKLYAHYKSYPDAETPLSMASIELDPNGGICSITTMNVPTDQVVEGLPTPYREGYRFVGWSDTKEDPESFFQPGNFSIVGRVRLYAIWEEIASDKAGE